MARGMLSGIGLGAVFSLGLAGVISVLVPIEPQRAPQVGTADSVAPPETSAVQPAVTITAQTGGTPTQPQARLRAPVDEHSPSAPATAAPPPRMTTEVGMPVSDAPPVEAGVSAPTSETAALAPRPEPVSALHSSPTDATPAMPTPLAQPQTGTAESLTPPRPAPPSVSVQTGVDDPVLPNPQALAPMIPDDSADSVVTQGAQLPVPPTAEGVAPPRPSEPEDTETAQTPELQNPVPQYPEAPDMPAATAPKPRVVPVPGTQSVTSGTSAQPRIGTPANSLITRTEEEGTVVAEETTQPGSDVSADAPPIRRYAQPFENPEGKPLMSIVLMDTGVDLDVGSIGLPALSSFPYPVSFAVDITLPDAANRAARFRAEGFDVLALIDLPQGARPVDAEVTLDVALSGMAEIVGVLEGTGEGVQGSREVADQVIRILQASGHGLVTQNRGLNSMPNLALKQGVPAAPVFRDFDSEGQQPRVIRRFLDQAAFKAGQEGGVIMLGRLRPETIEALLVWALADRASSVALAPVSAVLLAQ